MPKLKEVNEELSSNEVSNEHEIEDDANYWSSWSTYMQESLTTLSKKNKMDNVAIFVDYDNVYWTLMNNYSHDPNNEDPNKNLFIQLWTRYGQENVRAFRAYADFEKIRTQLTSLQKKRIQIRHVYSNGKDGDHRKNSSDIELCIDAIEHTYKDPNVSCYVFVTADSDMIPIISRMTYKSKRVELYYLSDSLPQHIDMTSFVNSSEDLLTFLNVEVINYEIDDYIVTALEFIRDWNVNYKTTDKFLGVPWLREQFTRKFGITSNVASRLIEKLKVDKLINEGTKKLSNDNVKPSINLTTKGSTLLSGLVSEVAATGNK